MLFKLVLTFIAAAHCLPTGYEKHAKSAERLHALDKELDALKHVAEPRMERRGTCEDECNSHFPFAAYNWFKKELMKKWGSPMSQTWDKMDETGDRDTILRFHTEFFDYRGCKRFCKLVDPE